MRKMTTLILLLLAIKLTAPPGANIPVLLNTEPTNNNEAIWRAVVQVESAGDPYAVHYEKGGFSVGVVQIRQCRIDEYNQLAGKDYTLDDCFDPEVSKEVFMFYAQRIRNEEMIIRRWNGSGRATIDYYKRIKQLL